MRVKQIWYYVPIPAKLKLLVDRFTFSRITTFYVCFSIVNFVIQLVFQVKAFTINAGAASFLKSIIVEGNATETGFTVLGADLRMCSTVPNTLDASSCPVVWSPSSNKTAPVSGDNSASPLSSYDILAAYTSTADVSSTAVPLASSVVIPSSVSISSLVSTSVASEPTSSELASSVSEPSHATVTVTDTIRPTLPIALLNPSQSDADSSVPASTIVVTRIVTVKSQPTQSASVSDDVEVSQKQKRDTAPATSTLSSVSFDGKQLSKVCLETLNWPLGSVDNTKREDIVFIGFSFWVLGMSLVAVLNESPPHIVAAFLTHAMSTGWAAVQLVNTNQFHNDFTRLTTHGACGVNLLPTYWSARAKAEIPTLALNALALVISAYLTWKLMKSFGWQTFKRIGASLTISRAYHGVLMLSIAIQLSVFFIVVSVALWIDQIYNGDIARHTTRSAAFQAVTILVLVLVIPWLSLGWISVRREYRLPMLAFLGLSILYLAGWGAMFASGTFRWTFAQWRFFSVMTSASVLLTVITFVVGLWCRLNFGKGLPRYLVGQEPLPGDDFVPAIVPQEKGGYEEKVDFPSFEKPIPTFAAAYPDSDIPPPPPAYGRTLGPRFYAQTANPFEEPAKSLSRQGSGSSQRSTESSHSTISSFSVGSETTIGKRWVIE